MINKIIKIIKYLHYIKYVKNKLYNEKCSAIDIIYKTVHREVGYYEDNLNRHCMSIGLKPKYKNIKELVDMVKST